MVREERSYHEDDGTDCYPGCKTSVCRFVIDTILCRFCCTAASWVDRAVRDCIHDGVC